MALLDWDLRVESGLTSARFIDRIDMDVWMVSARPTIGKGGPSSIGLSRLVSAVHTDWCTGCLD